jgi:phage terminase small subunit
VAKKPLTAKATTQQRLFIDRYLVDFNAGKAYQEIYQGASIETCRNQASKLMTHPDVQQYLQEKLTERKQQLHVDQNYVVRKLIDITEIDYVDAIQFLTRAQLEKIPTDVRKLIQSIKIVKSKIPNEFGDVETEKYEVTFMNKDKALELLGKHTGAFMRDNVQGQYDMGRMSFTDALGALDL